MDIEQPRWKATINYRTDNGAVDVVHYFEELEDLHDIVERGPSWYALINIDVRLASQHERLTVEQSEAE